VRDAVNVRESERVSEGVEVREVLRVGDAESVWEGDALSVGETE
jgi:hypothetical protein